MFSVGRLLHTAGILQFHPGSIRHTTQNTLSIQLINPLALTTSCLLVQVAKRFDTAPAFLWSLFDLVQERYGRRDLMP